MTDEQRIYKLSIAVAEAAGAIKAASEIFEKENRPKTSAKFAEIAVSMLKTLEETKPE